MATVFSNVTSGRGTAAMASRLDLVSFNICLVVCWISEGVRSHEMGGMVGSTDAFAARAFSTSLGAQVPQMELKSNDDDAVVALLEELGPSPSRMELEKALKQQGQRGIVVGVIFLLLLLLRFAVVCC